jgi:hypothetical protein
MTGVRLGLVKPPRQEAAPDQPSSHRRRDPTVFEVYPRAAGDHFGIDGSLPNSAVDDARREGGIALPVEGSLGRLISGTGTDVENDH